MKLSIISLLVTVVTAFRPLGSIARKFTTGMAASSFYDITEKDANGNEVSFAKFKGKVVYGVNVASKCGYTAAGYALLSKLSEMKDKGVEVAIFPCNQFGGQVFSFCIVPLYIALHMFSCYHVVLNIFIQ